MKKPSQMEIFSQDGGNMQGKKKTCGKPELKLFAKGKKMNFILNEIATLPKSRQLQHWLEFYVSHPEVLVKQYKD